MRNVALRRILIAIAVAGGLPAQPNITAVLNGASFSAAVSPGSWITIFGNSLAPTQATSSSLPATLAGVSVTIGGLSAPMSYVSPNQVNALIPFETAIPANTVVPLVLTNASTSTTYNIRLTRTSPAIFTVNGTGTGLAIISNPEGLAHIVGGYDYLFYATGLGPLDSSGRLTDGFDVYLGERKAQVLLATAISGLPGVYQVRVTAPDFIATDRLYLISGGWQSNIVDVPILTGSNTTNVSGTIDGLYPSSDPYFTLPPCTTDDPSGPPCAPGQDLSVMLYEGSFSVAYDLAPSNPTLGPFFTIAAVGEAGAVVIDVTRNGAYSASIIVPATATRFGDFSNSGVSLWDYLSCSPSAVCMPFAANRVPPNRLTPWWLQATQALPGPNVSSSGLNGTFLASGSLTGSNGSSDFVIDGQNNASLSKFGGFVQVPYGPFDRARLHLQTLRRRQAGRNERCALYGGASMKSPLAGIALSIAGIITPVGRAQTYVISTFAGGGALPMKAAATSLSLDWNSKGLTTDAAGNVYFTSLNCVFNLGPDGNVTRIAGDGRSGYSGDGGLATNAEFSMGQLVESPPYLGSLPPGLATDSAGNVYVADNGNARIRKTSAYGIVTTVAGNGSFGFSGDGGLAVDAQLSSVLGLAVDHVGNLLIADSDNHRLRILASDGTITTVAGNGVCGWSGDGGPAANAQLCNPTGIALDNLGNLFIAEAGNGRIRRISSEGIISTATIGVPSPTTVSIDASGNLYIVGGDGNFWEEWQAVRKVSPDRTITFVAGHACEPQTAYCPPSPSDGTTAATTFLSDRLSTTIDYTGNLLLAAPYSRRIYRVSPDGGIAAAAGNGDYDFSGDGGPASSARLSVGAIAADSLGDLFVADPNNARIRKISPDGIIRTIAGNGAWGFSGDGGPATSASLSPTGIAVDSAGDLFIGENLAGVRKISPDGIITTIAPGQGFEAVAVDRLGNLFIADYTVRRISLDGTTTAISSPAHALAVDDAGNLFLAEPLRVRRLSPDGTIITVAGNGTQGFSGDGGPATDAQLDYPSGIAVDSAGNLFIANRGNHRIRKVSRAGVITTVAGNGVTGYSGDGGPATEAGISWPSGIAVDRTGMVSFGDTANNVIRVLRPVY